MTHRRPAVIVLAAGRGMRFTGQGHKLVQSLDVAEDPATNRALSEAPLARVDTVLARTVSHALETGLRVLVVTQAALAASVQDLVPARDVLVLPELDSRGRPSPVGMGHSIAAGVSAAGDAEGWLILPADMPLLRASSILAVAEALQQFPVAYAQHRGHQGHPVGFSAELFSELVDLKGDEGARRIVARYPSQAVDLDDPGVLLDVDTVEDLERVKVQALAQVLARNRA